MTEVAIEVETDEGMNIRREGEMRESTAKLRRKG
jgi:hypothetical protein